MGDYATELLEWIDANGFVGRRPKPAPFEEGNPLLQNGVAVVIAFLKNDVSSDVVKWFEKSVRSLQVTPGIYNKKPGTRDQITRDDLYGVVAGSVHAGLNLHYEVMAYCEKHKGFMSNTGEIYWSAIARPYDIAFYKLAAGADPNLWELATLAVALACDMFNRSSASEKRLMWLVVKTIRGRSVWFDLVGKIWMFMTRRFWGSMQRVMVAYSGEYHLFAKWCPE